MYSGLARFALLLHASCYIIIRYALLVFYCNEVVLSVGMYGNSAMKVSNETDSDGTGVMKARSQPEQSAVFQQQVSAGSG